MINWAFRDLTKDTSINWTQIYSSVSTTVPPTGILITSSQMNEIVIDPPEMRMIFIEVVDSELIQMLVPCPAEAVGWWNQVPVFLVE